MQNRKAEEYHIPNSLCLWYDFFNNSATYCIVDWLNLVNHKPPKQSNKYEVAQYCVY